MKRDIFEEMMAIGAISMFKGAAAKAGDEMRNSTEEKIESMRKNKLTDSEIHDLLVYMDDSLAEAISEAIEKLDV